jgi:phosphoribosyl 1,2-cyclic phosphodiesterase
MDVHFCGVRGSTPAPGLPFVRYGGHTSCVALARDGQAPTLVLDAGTGLRNVTALCGGLPYDGTILLGHLHWDHVHGLPFFGAGLAPGARVDVHLPSPDADPVDTLSRGMSPPHFPVGPRQMGDGWSFSTLREGTLSIEGFDVLVREIPHKGGQTFGFRVSDGTSAVAYLSDHAPHVLGDGADGQGALHPAALELAADVDLLIHDAQFLAAQFPAVTFLGHSSVEYAVALAEAAGAHEVALYHHAPDRTDLQIDAIVASLRAAGVGRVGVRAATEATTVRPGISRQAVTSHIGADTG